MQMATSRKLLFARRSAVQLTVLVAFQVTIICSRTVHQSFFSASIPLKAALSYPRNCWPDHRTRYTPRSPITSTTFPTLPPSTDLSFLFLFTTTLDLYILSQPHSAILITRHLYKPGA
ncbi:hypothetical protein MRB53_042253 [Persea americana]|nr:hypothetical protein MRB53_042253 [Persea americana]